MLPDIPDDVMITIMEYLSLNDLARLALTSRDMYHIVGTQITQSNDALIYARLRLLDGSCS